jgi:hypothetical protein
MIIEGAQCEWAYFEVVALNGRGTTSTTVVQ